LPKIEFAAELRGGDSPLFRGREIDDIEILDNVEPYQMEKCVGGRVLPIVATCAMPRGGRHALAGVSMSTFVAAEAVNPVQFRQIGNAVLFCGEPLPELEKVQAFESLLHNINYCYPLLF